MVDKNDFHSNGLICTFYRIFAAFAYAQLFRQPFESVALRTHRYSVCIMNLVELFFLAMLSAVTSKANHFRHVLAFSGFQVHIVFKIRDVCSSELFCDI